MNGSSAFVDAANLPVSTHARGRAGATVAGVWGQLALAAAALIMAALCGLLIRIEWLTPPLDMMQARSFGALLTLHGALAFYFVFIPCGFYIPTLLGLARIHGDRPEPLPRLGAWAWTLQAAGLVVLLTGFLAGGSEAGWGLSNISGAQHALNGVGTVALAALLAGLALAAHGVRVWSASVAHRSETGAERAIRSVLMVGSVLGLMAGATLVLCMALMVAQRFAGLPLFEPAIGGLPLLYERFFAAFRQSAQTAGWFVPAGMMAAQFFTGRADASVSREWIALLGAALFAGLPLWGWGAALASAMGVVVLMGIGLIGLRQAYRAGALNAAHALQGLFWIAAIQALTLNLLVVIPAGQSIYSQTTVASANLHMLAYAVVGLALPGLLASGRANRPDASLALLIGGLVVFLGAQAALLPDLLAGLQGLSHRANAYPADFQVLKVLGSAGTTLILAGGAFLFVVLFAARREAPAA